METESFIGLPLPNWARLHQLVSQPSRNPEIWPKEPLEYHKLKTGEKYNSCSYGKARQVRSKGAFLGRLFWNSSTEECHKYFIGRIDRNFNCPLKSCCAKFCAKFRDKVQPLKYETERFYSCFYLKSKCSFKLWSPFWCLYYRSILELDSKGLFHSSNWHWKEDI